MKIVMVQNYGKETGDLYIVFYFTDDDAKAQEVMYVYICLRIFLDPRQQ